MAVIVHVGYPKTASTWFQDEYFKHITNYNVVNKKTVNKLICFKDSILFDFNNASAPLDYLQGNLLLTSELLLNSFNNWNYGNGVIVNAQKIKAYFPTAKIIIFIRNQKDIICSAYQQYVKLGGSYGVKKYIYGGRNFNFEHLLYDRVINYYESLFGKDAVHVYLYEDFKNDQKGFLEKFNNDFGFIVTSKQISFKPVNIGLRKGLYYVLRFFNLFSNNMIGKKALLVPLPCIMKIVFFMYNHFNKYKIFGKYMNSNNMLSAIDIEYIKNYYKNSNRNLAVRFGEEHLKSNSYYL